MMTSPHYHNYKEGKFCSPEDKWGWRRPQALEMTRQFADREILIVLAQVWLVIFRDDEPPSHTHVLPMQAEGRGAIYQWQNETAWDSDKMSWSEFCNRAAEEARRFIENATAEQDVLPQYREAVFYHLDYVTREVYEGI